MARPIRSIEIYLESPPVSSHSVWPFAKRTRMLPQEFIAKWQRANLSERSAAQQHFLDLCELLGQPKPATADPDGAWYTWKREYFAWEYNRRKPMA